MRLDCGESGRGVCGHQGQPVERKRDREDRSLYEIPTQGGERPEEAPFASTESKEKTETGSKREAESRTREMVRR